VVGVNTGSMVAGDVRSRVIREFHVLGDAVNIAARLKARAPRGSVYIGAETRREAGDDFECRELGPLKLKGKSEEVAIFELLRSLERRAGRGLASARSTDAARFVGRERELAWVASRLEELAAGRGGSCVLLGSEGIGKSRLLAEADALPVARRVDAVHVVAGRGELLLADLLEALESDAANAAARSMRAGSVRGVAAAALTAETLTSVAAARPLAVVLEDLHLADPEMLDLLPQLIAATSAGSVLFLLTARLELAEPLLQRLRDGVSGEPLVLGPGARPSVGSSITSSRGLESSAREIASICCSPPESCPPALFLRSARRGNVS
jgi:hypothetical protein